MLVVDEYEETEGIVTREDTFEAIIGLVIVDEGDFTTDMQAYARRLWKKRAQDLGFNPDE